MIYGERGQERGRGGERKDLPQATPTNILPTIIISYEPAVLLRYIITHAAIPMMLFKIIPNFLKNIKLSNSLKFYGSMNAILQI